LDKVSKGKIIVDCLLFIVDLRKVSSRKFQVSRGRKNGGRMVLGTTGVLSRESEERENGSKKRMVIKKSHK
jgi:hypothetical protein